MNLNLWRKAQTPANQPDTNIKFKSVKRETSNPTQKVHKKKVPVFKETQKMHQKSSKGNTIKLNPESTQNALKEANKLELVDAVDNDKENLVVNNLTNIDNEAKFHKLSKPKLSMKRKYLAKIEKEIGIRKWSRADSIPASQKPVQHNFRDSEYADEAKLEATSKATSQQPRSYSSGKKTMDLFSQAREALNKPDSEKYTKDVLTRDFKDHQRVREIQPMQKRAGLWKQAENKDESAERPKSHETTLSPNPKEGPEIPFSKNRYCNEGNNEELGKENKKKAIKFLKKQKEEKAKKEQERKKLLERKKQYTEQVRKLNREKLRKNRRRRNNSVEGINSDIKDLKHTTSIRAKSAETKGKSYNLARKFARERVAIGNYSDAKANNSMRKCRKYTKTLSVEKETN